MPNLSRRMPCPLVAAVAFFLQTSAPASAQDHPILALGESWFHLAGKDREGFTAYRRYALIPDSGALFRNTFIFNCSTDRRYPSHIVFAIPQEIDVTAIVGAHEVHERPFTIYTVAMDDEPAKYVLPGHVIGNEIFFDFVDDQKKAMADIIEGKRILISLSESHPLEWKVFFATDTLPLEDKRYSLDELVQLMMDRNGQQAALVSSARLFQDCPDLDEWRIQ